MQKGTVLPLWIIGTPERVKSKSRISLNSIIYNKKAVKYFLDFQNNLLYRCKVIEEKKSPGLFLQGFHE